MLTRNKMFMLFISLMLIFSLALTACNNSKGETASSDQPQSTGEPVNVPTATAVNHDPVTITISWWGTDSRHKALIAAVKMFEAKYNWITVQTNYSGWDGYHDKLTVQLGTGKAPDLFAYSVNLLEQYSKG